MYLKIFFLSKFSFEFREKYSVRLYDVEPIYFTYRKCSRHGIETYQFRMRRATAKIGIFT